MIFGSVCEVHVVTAIAMIFFYLQGSVFILFLALFALTAALAITLLHQSQRSFVRRNLLWLLCVFCALAANPMSMTDDLSQAGA